MPRSLIQLFCCYCFSSRLLIFYGVIVLLLRLSRLSLVCFWLTVCYFVRSLVCSACLFICLVFCYLFVCAFLSVCQSFFQ